jgi:large subunit ribosomal protein L18e
MKVKNKNPELRELIEKLNTMGVENPIWKAVARSLNRPRRKKYEVNLYRLEKYTKPNETIIVPGVVLGTGELTKPLKVAALKFSEKAEEKIKNSGGSCLSIEELAEKNPKGSKVRIMG